MVSVSQDDGSTNVVCISNLLTEAELADEQVGSVREVDALL